MSAGADELRVLDAEGRPPSVAAIQHRVAFASPRTPSSRKANGAHVVCTEAQKPASLRFVVLSDEILAIPGHTRCPFDNLVNLLFRSAQGSDAMPAMSGLSGNEMYCLNLKGLAPGELVLGNSVYSLGFLGSLGAGLRSIAGGEVTQVTQRDPRRPTAGVQPHDRGSRPARWPRHHQRLERPEKLSRQRRVSVDRHLRALRRFELPAT